MKFSKKQIERYSRQIILKKVGVIGQKKLLKSRVLIVGAGGLGSPIAIYLAALGIGKIGIIDKDTVEISNLSRQIIFTINDLKKTKSSAAIDRLKKINPDLKLKSFNINLKKNNINLVAKDFDLIVDGSDNFRTRFLINDYCLKKKKMPSNPDVDNCEYEGVLGTLGGIIGSIQANEVVKEILKIGDTLCGNILVIDGLKLTFRKVKLNKRSNCYCNDKKS